MSIFYNHCLSAEMSAMLLIILLKVLLGHRSPWGLCAESSCKTVYLCNCECSWSFGGCHYFCLLWRISCRCCWPWHQAGHQRSGWHEGCSLWMDPPVRSGTQPSASPPSSPPNQYAGCKLLAVYSCGSSLSPTRSPLHNTPDVILVRKFLESASFFFTSLDYWLFLSFNFFIQ